MKKLRDMLLKENFKQTYTAIWPGSGIPKYRLSSFYMEALSIYVISV